MKECSVIVTDNGLNVIYGDIRIQGLEDILLKRSLNDEGQSLKDYIASKNKDIEAINVIEDVKKKSKENNSDTVSEENK